VSTAKASGKVMEDGKIKSGLLSTFEMHWGWLPPNTFLMLCLMIIVVVGTVLYVYKKFKEPSLGR